MIATHNSWSYLPERRWWMRLLRFCSRCQDRTIGEQLKDGVRYFDLRLKFKRHLFGLAHGLVEYEAGSLTVSLRALDAVAEQEQLYVRVLMENRRPTPDVEDSFTYCCRMYERAYPNIRWVGGHGAHAPNWGRQYYRFKAQSPAITEIHASVCEKGWRRLMLRKFAMSHNTPSKIEHEGEILMLDYYEL